MVLVEVLDPQSYPILQADSSLSIKKAIRVVIVLVGCENSRPTVLVCRFFEDVPGADSLLRRREYLVNSRGVNLVGPGGYIRPKNCR